MVARAKPVRRKKSLSAWHAAFLAMLPAIREQARFAFRKMRLAAKEDAIEEVVCHSCAAFARLAARGKADVARPSALARFAVKQFRAGRRVGCKLNVHDVSSEYSQLRKHIRLERLDKQGRKSGQWEQILLEDRHAGPAETAAARIDVAEWFRRMRSRDRRIAHALGMGERTLDVAERFGLSPGRVSQKRLEFRRSWEGFQNENRPEEPLRDEDCLAVAG